MKQKTYNQTFKLRCVKTLEGGWYSLSYLSKIREVPKSTLSSWFEAYKRRGATFVEPQKRGPKEKEINQSFQDLVVKIWKQYKMGSQRIKLLLDEEGFGVSERQIQKVLKKNSLQLNKRTRPEQIKFVRYERSSKDELWHTDWSQCPFTGKQIIAFLDDYSRFLIHAEYFENATTENTILAFQNAIAKSGKPKEILTDNGTHFTNTQNRGDPKHNFTRFCNQNSIKHILGRVNHPQTNGKVERWFGTYKLEFDERFNTLDEFIAFYNEKRIHQGIYYKVPAERYLQNFKRSSIMS